MPRVFLPDLHPQQHFADTGQVSSDDVLRALFHCPLSITAAPFSWFTTSILLMPVASATARARSLL
eukprot:11178934-Lingulodinium_polyedra.AAC.1